MTIFRLLIYKTLQNSLEEIKNCNTILKDFWHVSYADDHCTILLVELDDASNPSFESILKLNELICTIRETLASSCKEIGGSLNRTKSEVIVWPKLSGDVIMAKSKFVWLGFSFKLDEKELLLFTKDKLIGKQTKILRTCARFKDLDISYKVRRKAYLVYLKPIIEVFMLGTHIHSEVQRFQSSVLKTLFGLPRSASTEQILSKLNLHSTQEIFEKQATRIYDRCGHVLEDLFQDDPMETRSGRKKLDIDRSMRKDFFTRVVQAYHRHDENIYSQKKQPFRLRDSDIANWVLKIRKRVSQKIRKQKRKHGRR